MAGLMLALLIPAAVAASAWVETEPALKLAPDPPQAGSVLEITLAEDLLAPGRMLVLLDPRRGRTLARRALGRYGVRRVRVPLPAGLQQLVVELRDGTSVVLRRPPGGTLDVVPAPADGATADTSNGDSPDQRTGDCPDRAPDPEQGRTALLDWVAACPLDHAGLRERDLSGVDLSGRDLRRADLRGADLSDARLAHADLSGALLLGARLDGADLAGADLQVADLGHASLFVTELAGADLRGADLRSARLVDAGFANADLSGARLDGADIDGADFTGATCPDGTRTVTSCIDHLELP